MDPVMAVALIGGTLIAVKSFAKKDEPGTGDNPNFDPNVGSGPNVSANADQMGYDRITQEEYEAQGGVEAGQVATVTNDNGEIVGTVVGTEGGNQVFQEADGTVHVRTAGEPEIDPIEPAKIQTAPAPNRIGVGVRPPPTATGAVRPTTTANVPSISLRAPKSRVSQSLIDTRIRSAARAGLRIPM